jgi:hypothetical protein
MIKAPDLTKIDRLSHLIVFNLSHLIVFNLSHLIVFKTTVEIGNKISGMMHRRSRMKSKFYL